MSLLEFGCKITALFLHRKENSSAYHETAGFNDEQRSFAGKPVLAVPVNDDLIVGR